MAKHAYLILAHEYNIVFESLIACIDDDRNDIYLHIDKKATDFPFENVKKAVHHSQIYFVDRVNANWASFQQVRAELILLEAATALGGYAYYHFLSGADLPLRSQNEIHEFFDKNAGFQFVEMKSGEKDLDRIQFVYPFQNEIKHGDSSFLNRIMIRMQRDLIEIQRHFNLRRNRTIHLFRGSNWLSITEDCANYILQEKRKIWKTFNYSFCGDELFVQTILANSTFASRIYRAYEEKVQNTMRYIDWNRGNPYVFRSEDYKSLISSDMMFARKFSDKIDVHIVEELRTHCLMKMSEKEKAT